MPKAHNKIIIKMIPSFICRDMWPNDFILGQSSKVEVTDKKNKLGQVLNSTFNCFNNGRNVMFNKETE